MKNFGFGWAVLLFTCLASAQASVVDRGTPLYSVGEEAAIQGEVRFEKRHTVVPLEICGTWGRCPQPKPYWVVVLTSGTSQFEIDHPYAAGEEVEPSTVNVNGVVTKPGNILRLKATVEYASVDYYILGAVRNVGAVLTFGDNLESLTDSITLTNWSCAGKLDNNTEIGIVVSESLDPQDRGDVYRMYLTGTEQTVEGPRVYHLANVKNAVGRRDGDKLVYEGRDVYNSLQLTLSAQEPTDRDIPSKVKFSITKSLDENPKFPSESEVDVICNTIR